MQVADGCAVGLVFVTFSYMHSLRGTFFPRSQGNLVLHTEVQQEVFLDAKLYSWLFFFFFSEFARE